MKNQINYTNEGTQPQVNNLSFAMQMAELEAKMEQNAIAVTIFMADHVCRDAMALPF